MHKKHERGAGKGWKEGKKKTKKRRYIEVQINEIKM